MATTAEASRLQCGQALADEVGQAGGVDQVDAAAAMLGVHDRRLQRVLGLDLQRIMVADRGAALYIARHLDCAGVQQQRLCQGGLAGRSRPEQAQVADAFDGWCGGCGHRSLLLEGRQLRR